VPRWPIALLAVVTVAGAAGVGAALRPDGSTDQPTTLTAVHDTAPDGTYSFVMRAAAVEDLYPGADRRLVLTMTNPYAFDLVVTGIRATLAGTSNAGCEPVPANLQLRDYTGELPVRVAAGSDTESGAVPLHMPNSVVDACQRATFTIALDADATRADA
jgi:hypothetical protein